MTAIVSSPSLSRLAVILLAVGLIVAYRLLMAKGE